MHFGPKLPKGLSRKTIKTKMDFTAFKIDGVGKWCSRLFLQFSRNLS